jgi:hypothetical protein
MTWLGYAEATDTSDPALRGVVICAALVALIGCMAVFPVWLAWWRGHRGWEAIRGVVIVWGLLAAVSVVQVTAAEMKWSREWMIRVRSGYYDPTDDQDRPGMPWGLWGGLGAGYGVIVGWAAVGRAGERK